MKEINAKENGFCNASELKTLPFQIIFKNSLWSKSILLKWIFYYCN